MWAGTGEANNASENQYGVGIYWLARGANTWQQVGWAELNGAGSYRIVWIDGYIYIATSHGLYRRAHTSSDSSRWKVVLQPNGDKVYPPSSSVTDVIAVPGTGGTQIMAVVGWAAGYSKPPTTGQHYAIDKARDLLGFAPRHSGRQYKERRFPRVPAGPSRIALGRRGRVSETGHVGRRSGWVFGPGSCHPKPRRGIRCCIAAPERTRTGSSSPGSPATPPMVRSGRCFSEIDLTTSCRPELAAIARLPGRGVGVGRRGAWPGTSRRRDSCS